MDHIPFYRASVSDDDIAEVVDTIRSGWLTTGPKTRRFESAFAEYLGHSHAVALNSCTAALHLALEAIHLKPGDCVLVPTMTFAATAEVVHYLGGTPILVDGRESDFNLDVTDAEQRLSRALAAGHRTVAILPVHFGGQIGDVDGVAALAAKYGLRVIEDAAHCCPAYYRSSESAPWSPVGRSADISCYSFYANKCITTGEGGMACTERQDYADHMRLLSLHGISRDPWMRYSASGSWYYEIVAAGYKYNLPDIAAALGLQQLKRADDFHRCRTRIAEHYSARLSHLEELHLPEVQPNRIHSWHLYIIRLQPGALDIGRSEFIEKLKSAGIGVSVHYVPLHMHPYYRETYGYRPEDLPCMSRVSAGIISLPIYPALKDSEVDYICDTIIDLVGEHRNRPARMAAVF